MLDGILMPTKKPKLQVVVDERFKALADYLAKEDRRTISNFIALLIEREIDSRLSVEKQQQILENAGLPPPFPEAATDTEANPPRRKRSK